MERPYKVLIVAMWFINLKNAVRKVGVKSRLPVQIVHNFVWGNKNFYGIIID